MNKIFFVLFILIFSFASANELPYNFSSTQTIPIKLHILNQISTKDEIVEGQKIDFVVVKNVKYNNKIILKAGEVIPARIENVITSGMNGFPAEIIVDNFEISNINKTQLLSTYTKKGTNRCFWVYPLKWALTPIPFVGSLTNFIKGGHAKIKKSDIVTLYYFPEWK